MSSREFPRRLNEEEKRTMFKVVTISKMKKID